MAKSFGRFVGGVALMLASGTAVAYAAGGTHEVAARIAQMQGSDDVALGTLGLTAEPLSGGVAAQLGMPAAASGAVVTSLAHNGPAARAGVLIGDVAVAINGKPIVGSAGLSALLDHRGRAELALLRDGVTRTVAIG